MNANVLVGRIMEVFGMNAMICKERGLSVQQCLDINKEAAMTIFQLNELAAEVIVLKWVEECKKNSIFTA